jgi:multidrug efflux pump subunit AcrA (membrane-fusion protein)
MKNVIIVILALTTLVTGYILLKANLKMSLEALEGRTEQVFRGNLTLPINATGEVRPAVRVEIKAEASGEVIELAKQPGDRVATGDLLIRLQKDDEQRSVNRATLDLEIAAARLETARINLEQTENADLQAAQAQVDQLKESVRLAKFRKDKLESLPPEQTNDEELLQRETYYKSQLAQLRSAEASLAKVRLAIPRAQQDVRQAQATFETAKNNLADAEKRLRETDIVAPIDGIVGDVRAQIGAVIQGGMTTLTGGTVLATVLDMDRLIVGAEVDESDIEQVRKIAPGWAIPGHDGELQMPADLEQAAGAMEHLPLITVESFRDQEFTGVIERIYPEPRTISGVVTYMVDVVITSENSELLLPGMRADVRFTSEHLENVVLCSNEAIREGPNGELGVHVPKPGVPASERETEFIPCKFGLSNGNYSQVLCEELTENMTVYTRLPVKQDKDTNKSG